MTNTHEKKFILNTLIGLIFTTGGISAIIYAAVTKPSEQDWVFWAIISAIAMNAGLLFLGRGVIHKVKADLIRRQKHKPRGEHMD